MNRNDTDGKIKVDSLRSDHTHTRWLFEMSSHSMFRNVMPLTGSVCPVCVSLCVFCASVCVWSDNRNLVLVVCIHSAFSFVCVQSE